MTEKDPELSALNVGELDIFVETMEPSNIETIGSQAWVDWHIRLQKLNQQAVLEASSLQEERTKETLISCGKLPVLIYEVICIQVWKSKILPHVLKLEPAPANTFGLYMVLYHEAVAVGLLETVLFHEDGAICISEVSVDLLDYAVEQLTTLVVLLNKDYLKNNKIDFDSETVLEELERQKNDLQFDISMRCISIVRYIAEHMEVAGVGASIATNMYKTHDLPSLISHLLTYEPWKRLNSKDEWEIFEMGRWTTKPEQTGMHRAEAQLWLCLRQLVLDPRLAHYYNIDDTRRTSFCRLLSKLHDTILDELPPLIDLKMFLCRLSVGDYSAPNKQTNGVKNPGCTLIEVVPQIKQNYIMKVHKKAKSLAKTQLSHFNMDGSEKSRDMAKKLLESYTSDAALAMDGGGAKCAKCGDKASKKCSRCKAEWYCGRECQVKQWPKHKELCDQFAKMLV